MYNTIAFGLLAFLSPFVYWIVKAVYNVYFHPLSHIPGPKLMAASGIPYAWHLYKGTLNETLHDAHKKYGEVIRLTPTELSFTSGDTAWQDIYGFRSSKDNKVPYLKDMDWYNIPPNGVPAIVAAPTVAYHTRHRRLLAHAFSDKALREQEYLLQQYVDLLIFRLGEQCEGKDRGMVDMVKWYNFTTFDIMGDLSFGESFHALDSRDYHPFIAMIYKGAARAIGFNLIMRRYPIIKKLSTLLGTGAPEEIRKQLFAFAFRQVDKRMELVTTRPDFMMYAQRHAGEEGQGLSRDELHSDMFIIIGAGSETTATTLAGATYMLSKHPEKLKRLQNEIRSTFKSQDEITIDAVNNLTYLIACLSEGLRLYPPVPTGFPRKVPPGGDTISGHQIAGGTSVYVSQYAANHSAQNFKYPDEWIPERWLEGNKEFDSDKKSATQPFSFGPRNCIGKNLALSEMRLIMAKVIWKFDFELLPESNDWMKQKVYTLWEKPPLMMRLKPVVR